MRTLVALKQHPYESRNRNPGDEYAATDSDARLLVLAGNARYKDEAPAGQTYETRDLTARRGGRNRKLDA